MVYCDFFIGNQGMLFTSFFCSVLPLCSTFHRFSGNFTRLDYPTLVQSPHKLGIFTEKPGKI